MRGLARIEGGGGRVRPGAGGFPSLGGVWPRAPVRVQPDAPGGCRYTNVFGGGCFGALSLENLAHRRTTDSELARSRGIRLSN